MATHYEFTKGAGLGVLLDSGSVLTTSRLHIYGVYSCVVGVFVRLVQGFRFLFLVTVTATVTLQENKDGIA